MTEQSSGGSSSMLKAFIPGLVLGFVAGGAVGVLSTTLGGGPALPDRSGAVEQHNNSHSFDDRAPRDGMVEDAADDAEDAIEQVEEGVDEVADEVEDQVEDLTEGDG